FGLGPQFQPFNPGDSYKATLTAKLPPLLPGSYRVIVRTDIYNEVYDADRANNTAASPGAFQVDVGKLTLGVPQPLDLSDGHDQLFRVDVGPGQTLRVGLTGAASGSPEVLLRSQDVPSDVAADAVSEPAAHGGATAVIPTTAAGTYYVLVRGQTTDPNDHPAPLAELLPCEPTDVHQGGGGAGRYVPTTTRGAQFQPGALVKLIRPGFAEYEPVNYRVVDDTTIIAEFDLRGAPHGLYDVAVINPDGEETIAPYRYLVERSIEPDVTVGMGGPRVIAAGKTGRYGVTVNSATNLDTPYVFFQFGAPERGTNPDAFGFRYVDFTSNLGGQPPAADAPGSALADVPWAGLDATLNTAGENLAPGYGLDLVTRDTVTQTFATAIYPGLLELAAGDSDGLAPLEAVLQSKYGLSVQQASDLNNFFPGLGDAFEAATQGNNPLDDLDPDKVAFKFQVTAAATVLTRAEFVQRMTADALRLRDSVLADPTASPVLVQLAADSDAWTQGYLAALEQAGLLRPEDQAPPVRQNPKVVSLAAVLATGVLAGPAGNQVTTTGDLLDFFSQVRKWYDGSPANAGADPLAADLHLSHPTHLENFDVFVPFSNKKGSANPDIPPGVHLPPASTRFFNGSGPLSRLATLTGPTGYGAQEFLPVGVPLPYTINFENDPQASSTVGQVQVVTRLDDHLDPHRFGLGDMQVGNIQVHVP